MPRLERTQWYDLTRDMNWQFKYVMEEEVFPKQLCDSRDIAAEVWWQWDEPYKISYSEYVHNQVDKDAGTYSVKAATSRSRMFEQLDPGWKSALVAHYGAITLVEYQGATGEARMGRFGRAAAWRNMATYGTLDELRHGQIQAYFSHTLLNKEPRADWTHKAYHTNNWTIIAARHLFDDMFQANEVVSTALQLTFTFETGFTNVQFLGLAADAMNVGDVEFGAMISSIQTDEARHAQQGEPTLRLLIEHGKKDVAQKLIDHAFWRSWRLFALLTGPAMDYYTPLEHRSLSFKEFFEENSERFAGHLSLVDRLLTGLIQPPTVPGALAYMGLSPSECGDDAADYAWAFRPSDSNTPQTKHTGGHHGNHTAASHV